MRNRRIILILGGLFGVSGLVFGVLLSIPDPPRPHQDGTTQSKLLLQKANAPTTFGTFERISQDDNTVDCHYKWQSFEQNRAADLQIERLRKLEHRHRLAGREYKPTPNGPTHEISISIDLNEKDRAKHSFGAPPQIDHEKLKEAKKDSVAHRALITLLAERGMRIVKDEATALEYFEAAYPWIVSQSKTCLANTARTLQQLEAQNNDNSQRGLIAVIASFVQSLPFKEPPKHYKLGEDNFYTTGLSMPLETLYEGQGDCDTKAVLFTALMANIPRSHIIFLKHVEKKNKKERGKGGHILVGVRGVPRRNDQKVTIQGADYIVLEMNHPWPVGQIPQKHAQRIRHFTHETVYPN